MKWGICLISLTIMQFFSVYYISPVYTIPDYLSYLINFRSEVKNKGVYITLSLRTDCPSPPPVVEG